MNDARRRSPREENPYVGPKPFGMTDPLYGRDREVRELRDLLISQRIVVLYSPSGAGKTSLIEANAAAPKPTPNGPSSEPPHAGLRWEMERARFRVLPVVRVNHVPVEAPVAGANRYVLSALLSLEEGHPPAGRRGMAELAHMTLAEYLGEWRSADEPARSDLLIFDQFEEFLTLDPTDQAAKEAFLTQVREVLQDDRRWALFSLREDHLGGLDPYAAEIPTHLAASYRLDLLGQNAAKAAMQTPAARAGVEFADAAAERLLNDLRRVRVPRADGSSVYGLGPHVEPVHLQVVCQRLWRDAARNGRIDPAVVAEVGAVDDALRRFYADAVAEVARQTGVPERTVRGWFDGQLITDQGIRGQVMEEPTETAGLPAPAVDALVDRHLVRRERRRGIPWLELAHDRLVAPVLADNDDWYPINLSALQQAAKAWDNGSRQSGFLLTGDALTLAEAWAGEHPNSLSDMEREFLEECRRRRAQQQLAETQEALAAATLLSEQREARLEAEEALRREAEQRANEQTRAARRIKRWTVAAALLAFVAVIAAVAAGYLWGDARTQWQTTSSQLLAKQAEDEQDRSTALLMAAEALGARDTIAARVAMLLLFERSPTPPLVWDRPIATLAGGEGEVQGIAFAPKSKFLVSVAVDGTLRLWSATAGSELDPKASATVDGIPRSVAFAPNGLSVVTGGSAGVQLWNARTLEPSLLVSDQDAAGASFSPDGKEIVFGGNDGLVRLYSIATQQTTTLPSPDENTRRINAVAYSSQGLIAAGREDGTISLWRRGAVPTVHGVVRPAIWAPDGMSSDVAGASITSLAFAPNGVVLGAGNSRGVVTRWNTFNLSPLGEPLSRDDWGIVGLAYSPDSAVVAAADRSGQVTLWWGSGQAAPGAVAAPELIETLSIEHLQGAWSVAFSADGAFLASGTGAGETILWSRIGQPLAKEIISDIGINSVAAVAFAPDGRHLAAGGATGTVRLCDMASAPMKCDTIAETTGPVRSIAFSRSSDRLAWGGSTGTITVARLDGGQEPLHLSVASAIEALAFSQDDQWLIAGTRNVPASGASDLRTDAILIWDATTGEAKAQRNRPPRATALTANSADQAVAIYDQEVALWSLEAGEIVDRRSLSLQDPESDSSSARQLGSVRSLMFDAAGTKLAAVGRDVVVWDTSTEEVLMQGQPQMLQQRRVAFAPDGDFLASGDIRGQIRLWDVQRGGRLVGKLGKLPAAIVGLAWLEDGTVTAIDVEGSVLKLSVNSAAWQATACQAANREFTVEEAQLYFGAVPSLACSDAIGHGAGVSGADGG